MTEMFFEHVQNHEREWGKETYNGRPRLADIMSAKVVVFWAVTIKDQAREIITLHDDFTELESYMTRLIFFTRAKAPDRRYIRAFLNQRPVKVRAIRVEFSVDDSA